MSDVILTKEEAEEVEQALNFARVLNIKNKEAMRIFMWGAAFGTSTKEANKETA